MIRGAIFDLDGTLLDSMGVWDTLGEEYLRGLGYAPRAGLNEVFKSLSLRQAALYYRTEYGVPLSVEQIMREVNAMVEHRYRFEVLPKPGVPALLRALAEQGVRMCIATATDRPMVEAALARCGLLPFFSDILTCTEAGHGKDEPFLFREGLARLGTDRKDTVIFEDALYAIRTAKADGFTVAGVYDVHEKNQAAVRELSDIYLPDFSDLSSLWKLSSVQ